MSSKTMGFENLLEAVPEALVGMDQQGVIRFVNHQTESLFGFERDDLVGQHIRTVLPEHLWQVYSEHREDYFSDPRARSMGLDLELKGRHQDGSEFPVNIHLSHIDTGDVLLVITAAGEVTKFRRALEESKLYTAIVENSNDAIIGKTLDGIITTWNPAAERLFGYSAEQIIGKSADLVVPADRAGETSDLLAKIRAGQQVGHLETIRVRKDGTIFPASVTVSPIHDADGAIVGASTIARDATGQEEAYQAARAMIESSLDSLVAISAEGLITDVNEATVKVTGIPREELIGMAFSECFTDPQKADEIYQKVFAEGIPGEYPLTIRHRDGSITEVLYNASVHRGGHGNVLAVFAASRDMTKLNEALAATRAMIESSLDSMVAISPEGRITDLNEATVKVTGVPRERLIGSAFSDYFTDPEKANEVYQRVFAKGMAVDYPLTMRHQDGRLTEVLFNASLYHDADGNVLGVFAAARDVTAQRLAQRLNEEQQATARDRLRELEQFNRLAVGRELKMIELKKEIERLRARLAADGTQAGGPH